MVGQRAISGKFAISISTSIQAGQDALEAIRNSAEVPAPNFVLDTSPGKHQIVWRVEGLDREQAESMLRAMADQFGGDPAATDSTRVLRLPGFANKKYDEQFIVQAHHESNEIYHARDFMVQEDSPETARHLGSESGRDFRRDTRASPNRIGPTPNAPLPAATIPHSSSSGSPISAPTTSTTPNTTRVTPLRRPKLNSMPGLLHAVRDSP